MSKTVIFNNTTYELDEAKLAQANESVVSFLTTELAGTGATVRFNGVTYEVDNTKLNQGRTELVEFLSTIEGEGKLIEIDGVEYAVSSSALEEATATVAETLVNLGPSSEGLAYKLNADGVSYKVTGIGTCTDTDVIIPAAYERLPVTSIGESAFRECDNLTSVTIPNSVTIIGDRAFLYCSSLTNIYINKEENFISGSPWGAPSATVHWNTPLPSEEGSLISFTIDGVEYQAEEGMTWAEWCESSYNTEWWVDSDNLVATYDNVVVTDTVATESIIANYEYYTDAA